MSNIGVIDNQLPRLKRIAKQIPLCRCCAGRLGIFDGITDAVRENVGIHTRCIPKHWDKHSKGINTGKCQEFKVNHE